MRHALALFVVFLVTVVWLSSQAILEAASLWIMISYIASGLLVFPIEIMLFTATSFISIFIVLHQINEIKLSLTQLPLTFMDRFVRNTGRLHLCLARALAKEAQAFGANCMRATELLIVSGLTAR